MCSGIVVCFTRVLFCEAAIEPVLHDRLDPASADPDAPDASPIRHANIRGRGYYH